MDTLLSTSTLTILACCNCGVLFAMPENLRAERKESGGSFWCPNGHRQHYTETEEQRLRKELDRERTMRERADARATGMRDQLDSATRSNRALRGVVTRTKNRVAAGVCPVAGCKRHFQDLQAHMHNQHPDYRDGGDDRG